MKKFDHQPLTLDHIADERKGYEQVMGAARVNDLERDLRHSDVKAAMTAARQDPVTQERAQAARLTGGIAKPDGRDRRGHRKWWSWAALQGDRYATAAVGMFREANRIASHLEQTARMVGAPVRRGM